MANSRFSLPLNIAEYKSETCQLGPAQKGIYMALLVHCFECGSLPAERIRLMRISGISDARQWTSLAPAVLELFPETATGRRHRGMDAANARIEGISAARQEASNKRWNGSPARQNGSDIHAAAAPLDPVPLDPVPVEGVPLGVQPIENAQDRICKSIPNKSKSKIEVQRESFGPSDRGEDAALALRKQVFDEGGEIVSRLTGRMNGQARSFVSKLLKEAGHDCTIVLDLLHDAERERPAEPTSWLIAAVRHRSGARLGIHGEIRRRWKLPTSFLTPVFDDERIAS